MDDEGPRPEIAPPSAPTVAPMIRRVTLYTRRGCHLCEVVEAVLASARAEEPFDLVVIDIDQDPALVARFGWDVPVVFVDGRKHAKYRLDRDRFLRRLRAPAAEVASLDERANSAGNAG
jgi:glutaredoxin